MGKKIIAVLLLLCLSISLFAGCGKTETKAPVADNPVETPNAGEETPAEGEGEPAEEAGSFDTSEHVVLTIYCIGDEGGIYADQHRSRYR